MLLYINIYIYSDILSDILPGILFNNYIQRFYLAQNTTFYLVYILTTANSNETSQRPPFFVDPIRPPRPGVHVPKVRLMFLCSTMFLGTFEMKLAVFFSTNVF